MTRLYLTIVLSLVLLPSLAWSQDYQQTVKLSNGKYWGVSTKYLTSFESGYEGHFQWNSNEVRSTLIRLYQTPAFPERSSKWFFCYGYGAHVAWYHKYSIYNIFTPFDPPRKHLKHFLSVGADAYIGLEYRFLKHPFVLSFDLMPNFEFFGPRYFRINSNSVALGIAYVINKN